MDTFPYDQYCPSYKGPETTADNRYNVAQFGDGYRQPVPDGININRDTYKVSWNSIDQAAMQDIWGFLSHRQGGGPFLFMLPDMDQPVPVFCASVTKKQQLSYLWNVTATIQRTAAIG